MGRFFFTGEVEMEHKFFERYLDNDLVELSSQLEDRYKKIQDAEVLGVTALAEEGESFVEAASVSTTKWRQYNVFQFHIPEIHKLYSSIREMVVEACDYYELDFSSQQYMVQGWFNIHEAKTGILDWHEHGIMGAPQFHGYYCVNAEPSVTQYAIDGVQVNVVNKNNKAILSEMGHPHKQITWDWEGRRISVAYDILPLDHLIRNLNKPEYEQHWIPLV